MGSRPIRGRYLGIGVSGHLAERCSVERSAAARLWPNRIKGTHSSQARPTRDSKHPVAQDVRLREVEAGADLARITPLTCPPGSQAAWREQIGRASCRERV